MSDKRHGVDRRRQHSPVDVSAGTPPEVRVEDDRPRRWLDRIAALEIFFDIPVGTLEALLHYCELRQLAPGELLLSPGEKNDTLYLLLEGRLNVNFERPTGDGDFLIEPGECVGEISIIDGRPATAFVAAAQPSVLLAVSESRFWSDFITNPQVARNFMRLFAERFRARNQMMQRALEERLRYEHLEKELGIAQEIQAGMLPHDLDLRPQIDIVAEMVPARHVGGDFYDVFALGDDEYCIAIGDVSGKGVPAALFMVRAMTLLRAEMLRPQTLEWAVQRLNAALCEDNERCMFVTLMVTVLNRRTGELRYVCAGHNPMVLGRKGAQFEFLPAPAGILAGVDEHATYASAGLRLVPGDVLILYTDGVTEAMNSQHELFTEDRLLACLRGDPGSSAAEVGARVDDAVAAFVDGAAPSDDLTMVVLRYLGS
ncbi:MAG: SpoIIE family protein phosphatase [Sedimenticolaceae bacterium]